MATKFSAALSGLKEAKTKQTPEDAPAPVTEQQAEPTKTPLRGPGRPKGRASDPNYTPTTILMDRKLKAQVTVDIALWKSDFAKHGPGPKDLSQLIEFLLKDWVRQIRRD